MFVVVVSTESLGDDGANRSAGSHRTLGGDRQLIDLGRVGEHDDHVGGLSSGLDHSNFLFTNASKSVILRKTEVLP